jgi:hypothetical protein
VTLDPNPLFPLADVVSPPAAMATDEGMASPEADAEGLASPEADADMASPVTDEDMVASPEATPVMGDTTGMGSASAIPAGQSTTVVEIALADILADDHAINVHLSNEDPGTYIACGAIGGVPDDNGNLFIGLAEQNDSGYSGVAWLHDNGDGTTTVTIFLGWGLHEADM